MSKSPINFGLMSGVANAQSAMMSGIYGNMSDEDLRSQYDSYSSLGPAFQGMSNIQSSLQAMQAEIDRRQSLGSFGLPQSSAVGGPGASFTDPNNTTTTGNFSINPNASGGLAAEVATGMPGDPTQFADGSEGYRVNRFGGFAGPTAGNFDEATTQAANKMFGNTIYRTGYDRSIPKKRKLITL